MNIMETGKDERHCYVQWFEGKKREAGVGVGKEGGDWNWRVRQREKGKDGLEERHKLKDVSKLSTNTVPLASEPSPCPHPAHLHFSLHFSFISLVAFPSWQNHNCPDHIRFTIVTYLFIQIFLSFLSSVNCITIPWIRIFQIFGVCGGLKIVLKVLFQGVETWKSLIWKRQLHVFKFKFKFTRDI